MTIATQTGYTWVNGKHTRLLHAGNQFTPSVITATADIGSTADLVENSLTRDRWVPFSTASAAATASIRLDLTSAAEGTCIAIGAHNLGTTGTDIVFEHDSNGDNTWTAIGALSPTDDSAIMFFFSGITTDRWRVSLTSDGLPEIGVIKIGAPLVFERPFYSDARPARMNRQTELIGNISNSGELLGRTKKRTILAEPYIFNNLTYDWVRANLDTPSGVIQSLEEDSAFAAWRPELTQDASYIMRANVSTPSPQGSRDLWSFSFSAEVYSYE